MSITINIPEGNPYFTGTKVLDGNTYRLTFRWNATTAKWYMDIDGISNSVSVHGKAVMCGKDLLKPHGYFELGELWLIDSLEQDEDPDFDSFGGRHRLVYYPIDSV